MLHEHCYFYQMHQLENGLRLTYTRLNSAKKLVLHSEDWRIPIPFSSLPTLPKDGTERSMSDGIQCSQSENDSNFEATSASLELFDQQDLNYLIRDFSFSKGTSELFVSRFNEWNLLYPGTTAIFYCKTGKDLLSFFFRKSNLSFCNDTGEDSYRIYTRWMRSLL